MSDGGSWAAPGGKPDDEREVGGGAPQQAAGVQPPPSPAQQPTGQPQYGQYAPPQPTGQPQYGQYAPPQPTGQPQYGQYAPPQPTGQPQYGQYAPPQPTGQPQYPPPYPQPQHGQSQYPQPPYPQQPPAWQDAAPRAAGMPGQNQWAPPPKPGLIPLRPLGFGTLLGAPFQVLRRNPKATFGSGLLVQLVIVVVTGVFVGLAVFWAISRAASVQGQEDADTVFAGSIGVVLASAIVPVILSLFASALLQAVLVIEVARGTLGEKRRLGELWKAAFRRTLPLTGWIALTIVAVLLALGLLVGLIALAAALGDQTGLVVGIVIAVLLGLGLGVLGAWVFTKLALVPSVIVLERAGIGRAMRRSWALTNGNFWRTLGVIWLVSAILSVAGQIIQTPFSFLLPIVAGVIDPNNSGSGIVAILVLYVVFLALSLLIGAVTSVVQAATVAVVYIDLRMRKEGLDIELQRFVESRQEGFETWPDPYTAGLPPRG